MTTPLVLVSSNNFPFSIQSCRSCYATQHSVAGTTTLDREWQFPMKTTLTMLRTWPSWSWSYGSWICNYLCNQCHYCCEFKPHSGKVHSIQQYEIKFVSGLWQDGCFLQLMKVAFKHHTCLMGIRFSFWSWIRRRHGVIVICNRLHFFHVIGCNL